MCLLALFKLIPGNLGNHVIPSSDLHYQIWTEFQWGRKDFCANEALPSSSYLYLREVKTPWDHPQMTSALGVRVTKEKMKLGRFCEFSESVL